MAIETRGRRFTELYGDQAAEHLRDVVNGVELERCRTCRDRCIAATLDAVGDCADCAAAAPWRWTRQQLRLEAA